MLTRASLRYYAGTNALVVLGVAVAVAVLAGALLVGTSVRNSLQQLALGRLGNTDAVVIAPTFFRTALAADVAAKSPEFVKAAAPLIVADAAVSHDESQRAAGRVAAYGVDQRFFDFHGVAGPAPQNREAFVSEALAAELGAKAGDSITLRVAKPSDIPLATLQGRRDAAGERIRLTVARVLDRASLGEFSLAPAQGPVLAIYVSLPRLQRDLAIDDRVNALLLALNDRPDDLISQVIAPAADLDDFGLRVRQSPDGRTIVESRAGLLTDDLAAGIRAVAGDNGLQSEGVLAYVANSLRVGDREVPYSVVAAKGPGRGTIRLNEWAAADLQAKAGDTVTLEYYVWSDEEGLSTSRAAFTLSAITPMKDDGADPTLTPEYPGISDAQDMTSWDPPFPVDLKRIRPRDEDYWDRYRAAPKAIISLEDGQRLWGSRYGNVSSLRLSGSASVTTQALDPAAAGLTARLVRDDAIAASQGTTDFGQYFLYFSFFLAVSALLLAYLFFAVGLEQRTTEVGLLASIGFSRSKIRNAFIREGLILTGTGAVIGSVAAVAYGALILYGLRTWWMGAVGTRDLLLHVDPAPLSAGVAGAFSVALLALWGGIRALSRRSPRALLKGATTDTTPRAKTITRIVAGAFAVLGLAMLSMAVTGNLDHTAGFFGAGGAWLVAGLCAASILLRRRSASSSLGRGTQGLFALGIRQSSARPARSVLSLALIAFASFVLVTVGAFKKDVSAAPTNARSGTGGFTLMGESVAPLMHDPNDAAGRDELGLAAEELDGVSITRFRLRPGDETSCLTLYRPTNPRIVAPESRFLESPRFTFAASMASSADEIANPWRLLNRTFEDGAIPAIADQTTLMYSLHLGIGDDFTFTPQGHEPIRLRIVGALADSVLQSEMIIGESAFMRLFPRQEGYRVWMIESPQAQRAAVTTYLEDRLSDFGLDVVDTRERWDSYHQVENTYLATFQALGSLGLLLGTIGLGAVLARNVLERRKEIALVRAIGFTPADVRTMVLAEGLTLVIGGLTIGAGCAFIAITPVLMERAQALPWASVIGLLVGVVITGSLASLAAIHITTRVPITAAIKGE